MKNNREEILKILDGLLKSEDIYACMLVTGGLVGIAPEVGKFNKEVIPVWEILQKTLDDMFVVMREYSKYNLDKIVIQLMDYEVIFFIVPYTDTALVVVTPNLANRGLLMIELDKARSNIIRLLK